MINLFKKLEENAFTGKVVKDLGALREFQMGTFNMISITYNALFTQKNDQKLFVLTHKQSSFMGFNITYLLFDKESLIKLKVAIDDVLKKM